MNILNWLYIVFVISKLTHAKAPIEVIFFIRSQDAPPQNQLSQHLKENLIRQSKELQPDYSIKVQILHELFNYPGEWSLLHIIPHLMSTTYMTRTTETTSPRTSGQIEIGEELITHLTRWIVFCEDTTSVNVRLLMQRLTLENHTQPLFLGHPLYDREPTIIHHFAFFENPKWFPYPMLRAGVVFSMPLLKSIADIFSNRNKHLKQKPLLRSEFSIDAAHELARFIYDNVQIPVTTEATATVTETPATARLTKATTSTTSSLNDGESPDVNVYHGATANNKVRSNSDITATAGHTGGHIHTRTSTTDIHSVAHDNASTMNVDTIKNNNKQGGSHSDFRHPNEIIDGGDSKSSSSSSATTQTKAKKIILKKASYICPEATWEHGHTKKKVKACAMYATQEATASALSSPLSCIPVKRDHIYFAVKTCSKYHKERLPIIKSTWAPYAKHIKFFSDIEDNTIPTINTGVTNVEMGHCAKTIQILKLALRDIEAQSSDDDNNYIFNSNNHFHHHLNQIEQKDRKIQWLVLSDDDTILSVSGVCQVLGCYNSMDEIYLGERYGYRLYAPDGFNYITGGGGIALSVPALQLIVQHCSCPSPSAPDDMILGSCLHTLQLKALHSSRFHQARPNDYPAERLEQEAPVSFHKFWQLDPNEIYRQWFFDADDRMLLMDAKDVESEKEVPQPPPEENLSYYHKSRNLLAKPEEINFNEFVPVSLIATLHHSKERHVDL
ncbi:beta-1,3-glucosyltransferase [Stomoxys calcitrans]|uniref:beta-1,3-glucosyltransferase n=1 Tax=Stomoxys calcitrans TaxID=35570 RepID=UPI0027E27D81|nr:beta-1,3-glucosyltransferase [Stomoxys calcitrans]XP_013114967.2 beta-1,3-glucosyltransferase [Stomoxys calcitrans]XP_013114968.2 beta-1,3-glucosyltransferase [Stomoxys calcitrans]XP_013114969.2 beta-1,3-glucosyltransferase [Stomoxys calcitrans]XP_013114970.2 beta-1,3-glucosyltransferase [Stomoxys calcitrans]